MNQRALTVCILLLVASGLSAQARLSGGLDVSLKNDGGVFSTRELVSLEAQSPLVDFVTSQSVNSDGKYGSDIANFRNSQSFFENYAVMETGYTTLHLNPVEFQIGRMRHSEVFDSPYSLFINSGNPSAVGAVLSYRDPVFAYESRWIRLNERSELGVDAPPAWNAANGGSGGFPDRGANIKTITFTLGHQKFGIQDAGVYTGRSFDLEYFVSPMPEYFTQYFYGTAGRPWTTSTNENNLIGFFWTWTDPKFKLGAQVLIDDFSLHFLFPVQVPNNPWKAAWTLGAELPTWAGTFGLHHAGALKYTFEPIDATVGKDAASAYGYTLYPDTRYGMKGGYRPFVIEDNALGYLHGENNLAILLTYENTWNRVFRGSSQVEFLVAGSNSPANPWHDARGSNEVGSHWIDDPVLQQSVVWTTDLRWALGDWELYFLTKLGGIWHVLELRDPVGLTGTEANLDRLVAIYKPSDTNKAVAMVSLGVSYRWNISSTLAWLRPLVP